MSPSALQYVVKANFNSKFEDLDDSMPIAGRGEHIHGKYLTFDKALERAEWIQDMKMSFEAEREGILMTDGPDVEGDRTDDYMWTERIKGSWRYFHVWIEERDRGGKAGDEARAIARMNGEEILRARPRGPDEMDEEEEDGQAGIFWYDHKTQTMVPVGASPPATPASPASPASLAPLEPLAPIDQNIQRVNSTDLSADKTSTVAALTPEEETPVYIIAEHFQLVPRGPFMMRDVTVSHPKVYTSLLAANKSAETYYAEALDRYPKAHIAWDKHDDYPSDVPFEGTFELKREDKRRIRVRVEEMTLDETRGEGEGDKGEGGSRGEEGGRADDVQGARKRRKV